MTQTHGWPGLLTALLSGEDLDADVTAWAMGEIMRGEATPAQVAGFVVALRAKGETVDEVEGLVRTMYEHATPLRVDGRAVDVVGTGGDRAQTVNISTMAAIVAAGAGARVVKHGNRAASSACGAADLLEELGIPLDLPPERVARMVDEVGITFCFAPVFHPALRFAAAPRRELGVPTTFNFLGPLANPARPAAQAVGVADARMAGIMAAVFAHRGISALVFRGDDGLDELTTTTTSHVWVVRDGDVRDETFDPVSLGIPPAKPESLRGADAAHNAGVALRLLDGERGPVRETVLLNTAATLVAYEPGEGTLTEQMATGYERAAQSVDSGSAANVLDRWVKTSTTRHPAR